MDLDKLNQASEEMKTLQNGSDKEMAALANFQQALNCRAHGPRNEQAISILRALSNSGSILVPKPLVLLELAGILRHSNPKEAASLYEQIKKDYPNTGVADESPTAAWANSRPKPDSPSSCLTSGGFGQSKRFANYAPWAVDSAASRGRQFPESRIRTAANTRATATASFIPALSGARAKNAGLHTRFSTNFRNRLLRIRWKSPKIARTVSRRPAAEHGTCRGARIGTRQSGTRPSGTRATQARTT